MWAGDGGMRRDGGNELPWKPVAREWAGESGSPGAPGTPNIMERRTLDFEVVNSSKRGANGVHPTWQLAVREFPHRIPDDPI